MFSTTSPLRFQVRSGSFFRYFLLFSITSPVRFLKKVFFFIFSALKPAKKVIFFPEMFHFHRSAFACRYHKGRSAIERTVSYKNNPPFRARVRQHTNCSLADFAWLPCNPRPVQPQQRFKATTLAHESQANSRAEEGLLAWLRSGNCLSRKTVA